MVSKNFYYAFKQLPPTSNFTQNLQNPKNYHCNLDVAAFFVYYRGTSNWISADPPKLLGEGTELTSAIKTQINKDTVRFTFEVFGEYKEE